MLYYVEPGGQRRLGIAVPKEMCEKLMEETHSGPFGGNFAARSLYNMSAQHYQYGMVCLLILLGSVGCVWCVQHIKVVADVLIHLSNQLQLDHPLRELVLML